MIWVVTLMLAGLALVLAEIFLPGLLAGLIGLLLLIAALVAAGIQFGPEGFLWVLAIELALGMVILIAWMKYFPNSPFGRIFSLPEADSQRSTEVTASAWIGKTGTALTPLRPSGTAKIDGRRVDVTTEGLHIESGATVSVVKVEGAAIIVRTLSNN